MIDISTGLPDGFTIDIELQESGLAQVWLREHMSVVRTFCLLPRQTSGQSHQQIIALAVSEANSKIQDGNPLPASAFML